MEQLHITLFCIGLLIVVLSLANRHIQRSHSTEPLLAMIFGIICGPSVFGFIDLPSWGSNKFEMVHVACMLTIAMALMATALRLPEPYIRNEKKSLGVILTAGMILMCLFSSLIIYWLFDVPFLLALLIGAIVSPTDPVIATSIVSGKVAEDNLPGRLRNFISTESGGNDGLGYVLVFLPFLLLSGSESPWSEWFFKILLWENLAAIFIAFGLGYGAGKLLQYSFKKDIINRKAFLAFCISLAFTVLGGMELIGTNGIIGVFAAGIGIDFLINNEEDIIAERVQEMMERLFTIPIFVLFGSILPWHDWLDLGWKAIALVLMILAFRRIPAIFLLKPFLPNLKHNRDRWFVGWFGPIGVAALFYASLMVQKLDQQLIWTIPTLIIFSSTIVHGVTAFPFTIRFSNYAKREKQAS